MELAYVVVGLVGKKQTSSGQLLLAAPRPYVSAAATARPCPPIRAGRHWAAAQRD